MDLSIQEKKLTGFQDGNCGGHLVFLIGAILAIFYLQVTLMILIKFQVNWTFVREKKKKLDVQDGYHGGHLGFPI